MACTVMRPQPKQYGGNMNFLFSTQEFLIPTYRREQPTDPRLDPREILRSFFSTIVVFPQRGIGPKQNYQTTVEDQKNRKIENDSGKWEKGITQNSILEWQNTIAVHQHLWRNTSPYRQSLIEPVDL